MLEHVAIEVALHRKAFVTYFALIVLLFGVPLHVTGEVAFLGIPLATAVTLIWLVTIDQVVLAFDGQRSSGVLEVVLKGIRDVVVYGPVLEVVVGVKSSGVVNDGLCACVTYFLILSRVGNM